MSFDKHSNFNKQANFTEVKFGENKPVLEVELNELQQIQNEARADIIRDSIPSGFTQLGDIDYEYCLNNENKIKLKTDSVAYVNGYRITIPKDTIIDIGKAPEKDAREDLLFLEVWKEEVNSTSELTLEGGEGQVEIPNNIKDSRYPIETTHRVALKWRIRHHANADFVNLIEGLYCPESVRHEQSPYAQGGLDSAYTFEDMNRNVDFAYVNRFRPVSKYYTATDWTRTTNNDVGLYVAGGGNYPGITEMHRFKSFDGYVYAIPMFRLYRKPSCGKAIPFEYSKINPKVDYSKFTKLMQEEKVERVVNETIKGNSLVNLGAVGRPYFNAQNSSQFTTNEYSNDSIKRGTVVSANVNNVTGWRYLGLGLTNISCLKYDTNYTVMFKSKGINSEISVQICDSSSTNFLCGTSVLAKDGVNLVNFKTTSNTSMTIKNQIIYFALGENHLSISNQPIVIGDVILIEGTLTQPVEYFERLKSLGEDDGNLITIKNGILNDDTYDINDGNQKLLAFSEVTHVNSTNTIIPTIEANVIKGEESTPLEKLGSKLETEGHEVIEFTKIKGKTIQNLVNVKDKQYTIGQNINAEICPTLKLDTWYTVLIYVSNNTLDAPIRFSGYSFGAGEGAVFHSDSTFKGDIDIIKAKETGLWRGKARLHTLGSNPDPMFTLFAGNPTSGSYTASAIVLEGDYMNTPLEELPFVEGIKSVGETEGNIITLHSTGKNIYNGISENTFTTTVDSWYFLDGKAGAYGDMSSKTDTIFTLPKGQYKFNYEGSYIQLCTVDESQSWGRDTLIDLKTDTKLVFRLKNGVGTVSFNNLYIEAGDILTGYEPYVEYTQNIYLKEPLRSLPNGICDELVGNKVIRRVGQLVLNGSEATSNFMMYNDGVEKVARFRVKFEGATGKLASWHSYCTNLPSNNKTTSYAIDSEGCYLDSTLTNSMWIHIDKSKLSRVSVEGFIAWLKLNPTTIYYELATPIEEHLVNVYEKESIKTYQLDAPLRSLPNGVKDEIKDGVLIRRCGEIILDGSEEWKEPSSDKPTEESGFVRFNSPITGSKKSSYCLCDKFKYETGATVALEKIYITATPNISITVPKSKIANIEALKVWLQTNPTKLIYELETSVEISLKEVKPQTANFSLQRQFGEGNWLRELPNGVKDTVENGKVIRRTKKLVLNGSENWTTSRFTEQSEFIGFELAGIGLKPGNRINLVCDKFNVIETINQNNTCEGIQASSTNDLLWIKIYKTRLTEQTIQGFKTWLQSNLITLIFELATPTEETLSTDNYMSYPCHDFNTYCGSMYVGEGRNYVISDNKMPSEDTIVVDTDFREIEGKAKVEDCKYKKNEEGYDTVYETGLGNNKLKLTPSNMEQGTSYNVDNITWEEAKNKASFTTTRVRMKDTFRVSPNTQYTINNTGNLQYVVKEFNANGIGIKDVGWFDTPYKFTTTANTKFMVLMFMKRDGSAITPTEVLNANFMLNLGDSALPYEPFVSNENIFENTEENDIDDLRHQVSLTGFNYDKILNESFDKLLRGEL